MAVASVLAIFVAEIPGASAPDASAGGHADAQTVTVAAPAGTGSGRPDGGFLPGAMLAGADVGIGGSPARHPAPWVRREVLLTVPAVPWDGGASGVDLYGAEKRTDGGVRLTSGDKIVLHSMHWVAAGNPEGWALEGRFRFLPERLPGCGRLEWVEVLGWNGRHLVKARIGRDTVSLYGSGADWESARVARTSGPRVVRLEFRDQRATLAIDGRQVISHRLPADGEQLITPRWADFGWAECDRMVTEWEWVAWETSPRPPIPEIAPYLLHPGVEPERALEALASGGFSEENGAALRALPLTLPSMLCAARTVVDDAVRLAARRAFEAQGRGRRVPAAQSRHQEGAELPPEGCPGDRMPEAEVRSRARRAARELAQLPFMVDGDVLTRAGWILEAPLEYSHDAQLHDEVRRSTCVPKRPCDCRPLPRFPLPPEAAAALRAREATWRWHTHPRFLYDAMAAAAEAFTAPEDQAQLVAHLRDIASGRRRCPPLGR